MSKPRLLDLFAGPGGAAVGYARAGFEVVGVDILPWQGFPYECHKGDALAFLTEHGNDFDAIHASPPCQTHSALKTSGNYNPDDYTDLLQPTIDALRDIGKPWIVENVPGAPMGTSPLLLCGSMFGLGYQRHRLFVGGGWNFPDWAPYPCDHSLLRKGSPYTFVVDPISGKQRREVSQREWLDSLGLDFVADPDAEGAIEYRARVKAGHGGKLESIPPAYTEWLGGLLMADLGHSTPRH